MAINPLGFEAVNLDATNDAEDLREMSKVLSNLVRYCDFKAAAIDRRKDDDIQVALSYESTCETIFNRLPSWAKW